MTTQVYWVWVPFSAPMIFGSAVETTVDAEHRDEQHQQQARECPEDFAVGHRCRSGGYGGQVTAS